MREVWSNRDRSSRDLSGAFLGGIIREEAGDSNCSEANRFRKAVCRSEFLLSAESSKSL